MVVSSGCANGRVCSRILKVLVYGFYGKGNTGDDLFIEAFYRLFPSIDFVFTDLIAINQLSDADAVFIGGGSILDTAPLLEDGALPILKSKKLFYLSVGTETDLHPLHQELMRLARLITVRTPDKLETISAFNPNTLYLPDIVYALNGSHTARREDKSVLILPNFFVVPQWDFPYWCHTAWHHFKAEFAQFADHLQQRGYRLDFFPMAVEDRNAAFELINQMKYRKHQVLPTSIPNSAQLIELFAKYQVIITQRYHGIVLAELARAPYLAIYHHDKLKDSYLNEGAFLSFYAIDKQALINAFDTTIQISVPSVLPIARHLFDDLARRVLELMG
jgi:polysaccharide pyruvyl transferase WcaK-like protein